MGKELVIPNVFIHVLLYGYFENAFEVFSRLKTVDFDSMNQSEKLNLKQDFESLRSRLRGNTFVSPSLATSFSKIFENGKAPYPLVVKLPPNEQVLFEMLIKMSFSQMRKAYKEYLKSNPAVSDNMPFIELLAPLRTSAAIEHLRKKFLKTHKIN